MNILIVEREEAVANLIQARLHELGHTATIEPSKDTALTLTQQNIFDIIIINPSPLNDARQTILGFRKGLSHYPYIILLSDEATLDTAIKSGANDCLLKPLDPRALEEKITNAQYMTSLVSRIGDEAEDFPSAGGVIAKSAFNQLFLSAIERGDRYAEQSFVLFISISNYSNILEMDGAYGADYAVAKLSQYLVRLRRQSDIIGQTAKYEYALMLQRPIYETEPVDAANRFAQALQTCEDITSSGTTPVEISVRLTSLPTGSNLIEHKIQNITPQE